MENPQCGFVFKHSTTCPSLMGQMSCLYLLDISSHWWFSIDMRGFCTRLWAVVTLRILVAWQKTGYVGLSTRLELLRWRDGFCVRDHLPPHPAWHARDSFGWQNRLIFETVTLLSETTLTADFSKLRFFRHMGSAVWSQWGSALSISRG